MLSGGVIGTLLVVALSMGPSYGTTLAVVVAAAALIALVTSLLTSSTRATLIVASCTAVFAVATALAYSASTFAGFASGLFAWVLLPAITGLFAPRSIAN